jgi:predicted PurR-regulated permease PerM
MWGLFVFLGIIIGVAIIIIGVAIIDFWNYTNKHKNIDK